MNELKNFLDSTARNSWVFDPKRNVQVYVRRSFRVIDGQMIENVLDIANVVVRPHLRGCKRFTRLMSFIEQTAPLYGVQMIFIENVIEPRLNGFFRERRYRRIAGSEPYCYFKMLEKPQTPISFTASR
jgi:N-acetylglutamate synthase-like GNAT family acetyltransferase